ncbi:MAG: [FeFe] hydrogenase H-cluster maturation GTPase HydF [Lentimicrobiaceae bacterium]|nr:[FeFe] hydrogenase H-cluster maturation GTPase HydF [Lentimicrobiaceae bacterium]
MVKSKNKALRPHIGIFGKRNTGKSSLINTLTGQDIAIVSDTPGTTTDPVNKTIEIRGIGPVVLIDTAGIDDKDSTLGNMRVDKTLKVVSEIDVAVLIFTDNDFGEFEKQIIKLFDENKVPFIIVHNKTDLTSLNTEVANNIKNTYNTNVVEFSTVTNKYVQLLIDKIQEVIPQSAWQKPSLLGDIISKGDIVLLVTPIDASAPEGRIILPQVQTIRDILDNDAISIVCKEDGAEQLIKSNKIIPKLVVTDSQVFNNVSKFVPDNIMLTSFSIILARQKANFEAYLKGTNHIEKLQNNDNILMLEACTHHVSCEDIGRVKIPNWLEKYTGKKLNFDFVAGLSPYDKNINKYSLVISCGGCMITQKQLQNRLQPFIDAGIPVSNYGMTIAFVNGIFKRAIHPFK